MEKESEKTLEAQLVDEVARRGGMTIKLTSQFHRGLPDRLVLLPHKTIAFVEMKSTGEKPRPLQIRAMRKLTSLGFRCFVADSSESLDDLLRRLDTRLDRINSDLTNAL